MLAQVCCLTKLGAMQGSRQGTAALQLLDLQKQCKQHAGSAVSGLTDKAVRLHVDAVDAVVVSGIQGTAWQSSRKPLTWSSEPGYEQMQLCPHMPLQPFICMAVLRASFGPSLGKQAVDLGVQQGACGHAASAEMHAHAS